MIYIDKLNEIFQKLEASNTEVIIVISSFHKSFLSIRPKEKIKKIKTIFDILKKKTSNQMLLMYPSFTHSFAETGIFNVKKTRPEQMGTMPLMAFKDGDFYRTLSPTSSFFTWPREIDLERKYNLSSFGEGSIFDWLAKKKCRILCLGDIPDSLNGWIIAHHSENICKVPYRYYKKFSGKIIDDNLNVFSHTQKHFARIEALNIKNDFSLLNKELRIKKLKEEFYSEQLNISSVWLNDVITLCNEIIKRNPYGLTNFE